MRSLINNHDLKIRCGRHRGLKINSTSTKLQEPIQEICKTFKTRKSIGGKTICVITGVHLDIAEKEVSTFLAETKLPISRI